MKEIGEYLKNRRLELGISLDEAEQYLKIRKKYLTAIEEGDESVLPGKAYFVGYLRNYASYLGIDQDVIDQMLGNSERKQITIENKVVLQRKKTRKYFAARMKSIHSNKEKKPISFAPFIKAIILILVISSVIFLINQFLNRPKKIPIPVSQKEELVTNQITSDEEKSLEQELTEIAEENIKNEEDLTPLSTLLAPLPEYVPVSISATEPTWIKIMQGEELLFESMIFSEENIIIKTEGAITLLTTDPNNISVLYDDQTIVPQTSENYRIVYYQINHSKE